MNEHQQGVVKNMSTSWYSAPTLCPPQQNSAPARELGLYSELQAIRDEVGLLATEIRHFQTFGVEGDFDEWAFSLTFLEARLTRIAEDGSCRGDA